MAELGLLQTSESNISRKVNVWEYEFLQSLLSPYGAPSYCERINVLIEEIKMDIFNGLVEDGEKNMNLSAYNLLERFFTVDILQRLGIDRHFQKEIKSVLDYTYNFWNNEKGVSWGGENFVGDLYSTALGFRVLRLNGYNVSSDIFQKFQDGGQLIYFEHCKEDNAKLRALLSLYKASEISFPDEKMLKQIKVLASTYLHQAVQANQELIDKNQLLAEVQYVMTYPWKCRAPRWEAWNFIKIFRQENKSLVLMKEDYEIPSERRKKILELAILDFNVLQAQHQSELKILSKWWDETNVKKLGFFRQRHVEFYFICACMLYERELSATRLCFAKVGSLITLIDDIFDTYGTINEVTPFAKTLIEWDMSIHHLPDYMKISFQFAHKTYMDIATEAEKIHGPHVREWMHTYWKSLILAQHQDAKWIADGYQPSLEEYLKSSIISTTVPVLSLFATLLINTYFPDDLIERINTFESSVAKGCRLLDDSKDFQEEKEHGEKASWIECYIKDNPGTTREQALHHVNMLTEINFEELMRGLLFYEYDIPSICKRLYFDMYRSVAFIFRDIDGFSHSSKGIKNDIMKILVEPILF